MMDISTPRNGIVFITLFRLGGYQIDTCLPFSLYLVFALDQSKHIRIGLNVVEPV